MNKYDEAMRQADESLMETRCMLGGAVVGLLLGLFAVALIRGWI